MLKVIILVCSLNAPCERDTAETVMVMPERITICGVQGQEFAAKVAEMVGEDRYVKTLCVRDQG